MATLAKPWIDKILDMSTGHITKKDDDLLGNKDFENPLSLYRFDYGYFVFCMGAESGWAGVLLNYGYSQALVDILALGKSLDCKFVKLDCDGMEYKELPTFEW